MCHWCNATPAWVLLGLQLGRITYSQISSGVRVDKKKKAGDLGSTVFQSLPVPQWLLTNYLWSKDATLGNPYVVYNLIAAAHGTQSLITLCFIMWYCSIRICAVNISVTLSLQSFALDEQNIQNSSNWVRTCGLCLFLTICASICLINVHKLCFVIWGQSCLKCSFSDL